MRIKCHRMRPRLPNGCLVISRTAVIVLLALASWATAAALGASPESFPRVGPSRTCPQATVPQIYPGYPPGGIRPQEIDIFGRDGPSCAQAIRLLRLAPTKVAQHRWGRVGTWRCVWQVAWEECKRAAVRVYASNPGD
jgi:hypothetical protein